MLNDFTQHDQRFEQGCHPERPKKIEDFQRETKDLRTDLSAYVPSVRRFFDSADAPLRMTDLRHCAFSVLLPQVDKQFLIIPKIVEITGIPLENVGLSCYNIK